MMTLNISQKRNGRCECLRGSLCQWCLSLSQEESRIYWYFGRTALNGHWDHILDTDETEICRMEAEIEAASPSPSPPSKPKPPADPGIWNALKVACYIPSLWPFRMGGR